MRDSLALVMHYNRSRKVLLFLILGAYSCTSFRITDINDHHWQALESNMVEEEDVGHGHGDPQVKNKRFDYDSQKLSKDQIGKNRHSFACRLDFFNF